MNERPMALPGSLRVRFDDLGGMTAVMEVQR